MRRGKLRTNNPRLQASLPFNLKSSYLIFLLSNVLTILLAASKILCDKAGYKADQVISTSRGSYTHVLQF